MIKKLKILILSLVLASFCSNVFSMDNAQQIFQVASGIVETLKKQIQDNGLPQELNNNIFQIAENNVDFMIDMALKDASNDPDIDIAKTKIKGILAKAHKLKNQPKPSSSNSSEQQDPNNIQLPFKEDIKILQNAVGEELKGLEQNPKASKAVNSFVDRLEQELQEESQSPIQNNFKEKLANIINKSKMPNDNSQPSSSSPNTGKGQITLESLKKALKDNVSDPEKRKSEVSSTIDSILNEAHVPYFFQPMFKKPLEDAINKELEGATADNIDQKIEDALNKANENAKNLVNSIDPDLKNVIPKTAQEAIDSSLKDGRKVKRKLSPKMKQAQDVISNLASEAKDIDINTYANVANILLNHDALLNADPELKTKLQNILNNVQQAREDGKSTIDDMQGLVDVVVKAGENVDLSKTMDALEKNLESISPEKKQKVSELKKLLKELETDQKNAPKPSSSNPSPTSNAKKRKNRSGFDIGMDDVNKGIEETKEQVKEQTDKIKKIGKITSLLKEIVAKDNTAEIEAKMTDEQKKELAEARKEFAEYKKSVESGQLDKEMKQNKLEIEKELEEDYQQRKKEVRTRNNILWSIPAAFPLKEMDQNIDNLHMNLPLDIEVKTPFVKDANRTLKQVIFPPLQNTESLIGIGLYQSDLKRMGLIGVNLATEYVTYKKIREARFKKIHELFGNYLDELISKLEKIESIDIDEDDSKIKQKELETELRKFIDDKSALVKYNPFKKETLLPIIIYFTSKKITESFADRTPELSSAWKFNLNKNNGNGIQISDEFKAFTKDKNGKLKESGVYPISIVSIAEAIFSPLSNLSWGVSEILNIGFFTFSSLLKTADKNVGIKFPNFCYKGQTRELEKQLSIEQDQNKRAELQSKIDAERRGIPEIFYKIASSIIGEVIVMGIAIKLFDSHMNKQWTNYALKNKEKLHELLIEYKKALSAVKRDSKFQKNLELAEQNLKAFIEVGHSIGGITPWRSFVNWLQTKNSALSKVKWAALATVLLPPILFKLISSLRK